MKAQLLIRNLIEALIIFIFLPIPSQATIYYIKPTGIDNNSGLSWSEAYKTIQKALTQSVAGDEIWVAMGTYYPTMGINRGAGFVMKEGVTIYGGFPANGAPVFSERDWNAYPTILSGDIGVPGDNSDNSYHVVFNNNNNLTETSKLDGFIIRDGNANGNGINNSGGGIYNRASSPAFRNCTIMQNVATSRGGGMYNLLDAMPQVTNCKFLGNAAAYGGGVSNYSITGNQQLFLNCIFSGNLATVWGGGLSTEELSITEISFCTFSGNSSMSGGAVYFTDYSYVQIGESVLWGNSDEIANDEISISAFVNRSIVGGGYNGNDIIDVDPLFLQQPDFANAPTIEGDLHLQSNSPAVDYITSLSHPFDLENIMRPIGSGIDLGAFEFHFPCVSGNIVYVNAQALGNNDGSDWDNAFIELQSAIILSDGCPEVTEIWVGAGTYFPTTGTIRGKSFILRDDIAIYGGFPNTGNPSFEMRDWEIYPTILSGDIGVLGDNSDNSYHVIHNDNNNLNSSSKIDGFTIRDGNANGPGDSGKTGAGIRNSSASPTIVNCRIINNVSMNYGGGMYSNAGSYVLENCIFEGNVSLDGGGIYLTETEGFQVKGCQFVANSASNGGAFYSSDADLYVENSLFSGNSTVYSGTAIFASNSTVELRHCTISGNTASNGYNSTILSSYSTIYIYNSIIWGNSAFLPASNSIDCQYSIVEGGYQGEGNLNQNPVFVTMPDFNNAPTNVGNLRLQMDSPAIDSANPDLAIDVDYDGKPRPINLGFYDMGAFEYGTPCFVSNILYVNQNAAGNNDGSDWTNAFNDLQDAIAFANFCIDISEIWIAEGVYTTTSGSDRSVSFNMRNNLIWYGGFPANGFPEFSDRDFKAYPTLLSADIGILGDHSDNSYHVINNESAGLDATAILDGFTLMHGYADGTGFDAFGGGILNVTSSPTIRNCSFLENYAVFEGGGMYNDESSPLMDACLFTGNHAGSFGGGMSNIVANPQMTNCAFSGNFAASGGGGMRNYILSSPIVTNCSFSGNATNGEGGAMNNEFLCEPTITNSIFWGNSSEFFNDNSIPIVTYSIIQGGLAGDANIDIDPLFVEQPDFNLAPTSVGNLHLQQCSPAIDVGTIIGASLMDIDGETRPKGAAIDIGSDENGIECCPSGHVVYVNALADGTDSGDSWENAIKDLQKALNWAYNCSNVTEIWVAEGTYKTTIDTARHSFFGLKSGKSLYGGFPNYGNPDFNDRDWEAYPTILSGDIGILGDNNDNSYHVVKNYSPPENLIFSELGTFDLVDSLRTFTQSSGALPLMAETFRILDGFTIRDGNANGAEYAESFGGGFYNVADMVIRNCLIKDNRASFIGGGFYTRFQDVSIEGCIIENNSADSSGGGVAIASSIVINECTFQNNQAMKGGGLYCEYYSSVDLNNSNFFNNTAYDGGGVYINGGGLGIIKTCKLSGNQANNNGGGLCANGGIAIVTGSLFSGNYAIKDGGGAYGPQSFFVNVTFSGNKADGLFGAIASPFAVSLQNSIIWGNGDVWPMPGASSSIIEGYTDGFNLLNVDPLFVEQPDYNEAPTLSGNLRLQPCSPAIDAGIAFSDPALQVDLDNNPRPSDGNGDGVATFDMGAYEFPYPGGVAMCRDISVQLGADHTYTLLATELDNGSIGCGNLNFLIDGQSSLLLDCEDAGVLPLTLTVQDENNQQFECIAQVTIAADDFPCCDLPTASCLPNLNADLDQISGQVMLYATDFDNGSTASCGLQTLSINQDLFTCNEVGINEVMFTITDINGNSDECITQLSIRDLSKPAITCPANFVVTAAPQQTEAFVSIPQPQASDNCGIETLISRYRPVNNSGMPTGPWSAWAADHSGQFPIGRYRVLWYAIDPSGNKRGCNFFITVEATPGAALAENQIEVVQDANLNLEPDMHIFPNPATAIVHIYWEGLTSEQAVLSLLDPLGREIYREQVATQTEAAAINLTAMLISDGQYTVKLVSGEAILVKPLVVVR
ncbi:MAG TPA: choice-of-anchor Q domain-containing protein [Saprospiraceae bacterium]|nr:choice-of-anchor Q domain-containing protein [Saprospiraceae bacterium]HMQ84167.1 choice-of-anchor Q domain-containing protein [Saprospiraceae bacterium]